MNHAIKISRIWVAGYQNCGIEVVIPNGGVYYWKWRSCTEFFSEVPLENWLMIRRKASQEREVETELSREYRRASNKHHRFSAAQRSAFSPCSHNTGRLVLFRQHLEGLRSWRQAKSRPFIGIVRTLYSVASKLWEWSNAKTALRVDLIFQAVMCCNSSQRVISWIGARTRSKMRIIVGLWLYNHVRQELVTISAHHGCRSMTLSRHLFVTSLILGATFHDGVATAAEMHLVKHIAY